MTGRTHVTLAREAAAVGLIVTRLIPHACRCGTEPEEEYTVQLWAADGTLWAEGTHESADAVRRLIRGYATRARGDQVVHTGYTTVAPDHEEDPDA